MQPIGHLIEPRRNATVTQSKYSGTLLHYILMEIHRNLNMLNLNITKFFVCF